MQTFTPLEYLKIDVASNYGLDKEDWSTRIAWFDQNEAALEALLALSKSQLRYDPLMKAADSPALFYAGILAWSQARRGLPIGYPISLDATASGAQLLSVLIGCDKSAPLCNVVDTGKREDLYTNVYQLMLKRLVTTATIDRGDTKQAVMTSLYGSQAQPKKVFGEGDQLNVFHETMNEDLTGIWELNQSLLDLWNPAALSHDWVLPDNFHVKTKVMDDREEYAQWLDAPVVVRTKVNRPMETGRSLGANTVHSIDGMVVREISRRCSYNAEKIEGLLRLLNSGAHWQGDKTRECDQLLAQLIEHYEASGFLSARVLELIDEENIHYFRGTARKALEDLVVSLPDRPFSVLAVHDCFRVHPNYGNDLRRTYNQVLHEIAKSDLLTFIASQLVGSPVKVQKFSDLSANVLQSNYALS